jgi:hypothetical protein
VDRREGSLRLNHVKRTSQQEQRKIMNQTKIVIYQDVAKVGTTTVTRPEPRSNTPPTPVTGQKADFRKLSASRIQQRLPMRPTIASALNE